MLLSQRTPLSASMLDVVETIQLPMNLFLLDFFKLNLLVAVPGEARDRGPQALPLRRPAVREASHGASDRLHEPLLGWALGRLGETAVIYVICLNVSSF